jgi:6-phosphofructokinase 2
LEGVKCGHLQFQNSETLIVTRRNLMAFIPTLTLNPSVDKSAHIERVVPEQKLRCKIPSYDPGGGGINVARAIGKLGGKSSAFYTAGQSPGQMLQDLLKDEGIAHHPISIEGPTRESFTVYEESTGQQYRFSVPGPTLSKTEWHKCLDAFFSQNVKAEYIVVSGSIPRGVPKDFYARIAKRAKQNGIKMILDASGEPFLLALREGVFLIKPNLREFRTLAETDVMTDSQCVELAHHLISSGQTKVVVVSLGASGALLVEQSAHRRLRAPAVPIQSKVGAGDSMVAGIGLGLSRGYSMADAARFGVAAGTAAVMTAGTELCSREDTERLYDSID